MHAEYEITSLIDQLIHGVFLVVDPLGKVFGQSADAQPALRAIQPVAADDVCNIYMLNYADTCLENLVSVFDKFFILQSKWGKRQRMSREREIKLLQLFYSYVTITIYVMLNYIFSCSEINVPDAAARNVQ